MALVPEKTASLVTSPSPPSPPLLVSSGNSVSPLSSSRRRTPGGSFSAAKAIVGPRPSSPSRGNTRRLDRTKSSCEEEVASGSSLIETAGQTYRRCNDRAGRLVFRGIEQKGAK